MADKHADTAVQVRLIWIEKRIQYWLLFGEPLGEEIIDRRRKKVSFDADQIFALVRWKSNDYGTVFSAIDILQAGPRDGDNIDIRSVKGHVISLLSITGWHKVKQVMEHVDAIRALDIDPEHVCPDHWRHVEARFLAGDVPRTYTRARHEVWLQRGSLST